MTLASPVNKSDSDQIHSQSMQSQVKVFFLLHTEPKAHLGELIVYPWSGFRRSQCSSIFFSETTWPIKAKFYVELTWVVGTKFCSRHVGHMTKMPATPIYGNQRTNGPVNAHLISWPNKAQNIQNLENI